MFVHTTIINGSIDDTSKCLFFLLGGLLGEGETNIDSDTNCSSMLSSIVSSDALSCFTDGDITKATSIQLNNSINLSTGNHVVAGILALSSCR